jgi:hypothetical protein
MVKQKQQNEYAGSGVFYHAAILKNENNNLRINLLKLQAIAAMTKQKPVSMHEICQWKNKLFNGYRKTIIRIVQLNLCNPTFVL